MATNSADLMKHRRIVYPMPRSMSWKRGCSCGWEGHVSLVARVSVKSDEVQDELDAMYVAHIPETERRLYVKVDRRPGSEGQWIMPEGVPCGFEQWHEDAGVYRAALKWPVTTTLPIGEIITEDGRVFRME